MSAPNITASGDIKTFTDANLSPSITDLLTGLATAIKAADLAVTAGNGSPAYQAALVNVQRATVDYQSALKYLLPA